MEKLLRFLKEYPWPVFFVAYGVLETILKVSSNVTTSAKFVHWLLEAGTHIDQGKVVPAGWLIFLLTGAFIGFVIFLGAYVVTEFKLHRSLKSNTGLKTLDRTFDATSKIRNSLWPRNQRPPHAFTTIKIRKLIHQDLSVTAYSEQHVKAVEGPLHYIIWSTRPEDEATPVDHLIETGFELKDITPNGNFEVEYLQCENGPRSKEILIYFLPLLQQAEPNPRVIAITYVWPGYYLRLKEREEVSSINLTKMRSNATVDLIELEFYLEPGTGKNLSCERSGSLQGLQSPPVAATFRHSDGRDWQGWKYTIRDAPPEIYAVHLELKTS